MVINKQLKHSESPTLDISSNKKEGRPKLPTDEAICTQINETLKKIYPDPMETFHAFEEMFGHLKFRNQNSAAAYYILTNIFENEKFKFLDDSRFPARDAKRIYDKKVYVSPSLKKFEDISAILFNKNNISRTTLETIQNQFLKEGIMARILFTKNNKPYENRFERFFPINPLTIWDEIHITKKDKNTIHENIILSFNKNLYQDKFGINSKLMHNNYNIINFNTKWFIYMLLTHVNSGSKLMMQLSNIKSVKDDPNDMLERLLTKKTTILALLDQREKEQIFRAKELTENHKNFKVKYTNEELKGTSRRIILDGVFAADVIKILPPENKKSNQLSYVGVLYTDKNIGHFKNSFNIWYGQGTDLENVKVKASKKLESKG